MLILVQLLASQNRYRLMSGIAVANFALKAALNAVLAPRMGAAGIMLATSLMYLLSFACYLAVALRRADERPIECPPFNAPPAARAAVHSFVARRRRRRVAVDLSAHWARGRDVMVVTQAGKEDDAYALDPKVSRAVLNTVGEGGGLRGIWSNVRRVRCAA